MLRIALLVTALALVVVVLPARADSLQQLGQEAWDWRAATQPATGDDIPRIARPEGWLPDWSPEAVQARYDRL